MLNPERTIAIVCGADEWPELATFEAAKAFANSAELIRDYLTRQNALGLPADHILWLFGEPESGAQYRRIEDFLKRQFEALDSPHGKGVLILFFYVGHGSLFGRPQEYCLLLRDTREPLEADTSLRVVSLARLLRTRAQKSSRILFLDCCFAAEAARVFQGGLDQAVSAKAREVLKETPTDRGVALFCASSAHNYARLKSPDSYTLFSHELIQALTKGDPGTSSALSLRQLCDLVQDGLHKSGVKDAPRPEVHVPDQTEGDLAARPLFPNPARAQGQGLTDLHRAADAPSEVASAPIGGIGDQDASATEPQVQAKAIEPVSGLEKPPSERATGFEKVVSLTNERRAQRYEEQDRLIEAIEDDPDYKHVADALDFALGSGAISEGFRDVSDGFRIRVGHTLDGYRLIFKFESDLPSGSRILRKVVTWSPQKDRTNFSMVWNPSTQAAVIFDTLREVLAKERMVISEEEFDVFFALQNLVQSLNISIQARRSQRLRPSKPVIEIVDDQWAFTEEGLESLTDNFSLSDSKFPKRNPRNKRGIDKKDYERPQAPPNVDQSNWDQLMLVAENIYPWPQRGDSRLHLPPLL